MTTRPSRFQHPADPTRNGRLVRQQAWGRGKAGLNQQYQLRGKRPKSLAVSDENPGSVQNCALALIRQLKASVEDDQRAQAEFILEKLRGLIERM